jgi:hypothetical protein
MAMLKREKYRGMSLAEHIARTRKTKNEYRNLIGHPVGKK